jgi:hypothetical protein
MRVRNSLLMSLMIVLWVTCLMTQRAQAEVTTNLEVPVNIGVFIPCAAGGAGEVVFLTGDLHVLLRFTIDNVGGIHAGAHFQPQGVSGMGQTTGDKYQGTGVTQDEFNAKLGVEETFINNFHIIGQRNGNKFLVHETFHITINANGVVTAFVDNFSVDCR